VGVWPLDTVAVASAGRGAGAEWKGGRATAGEAIEARADVLRTKFVLLFIHLRSRDNGVCRNPHFHQLSTRPPPASARPASSPLHSC
jgi:hypothetical protein